MNLMSGTYLSSECLNGKTCFGPVLYGVFKFILQLLRSMFLFLNQVSPEFGIPMAVDMTSLEGVNLAHHSHTSERLAREIRE